METGERRLVVVSNRLPVAISKDGEGWKIEHSPGGLVTALGPIIKRTHGEWIGWPGCGGDIPFEDLLKKHSDAQQYRLIPVEISEDEAARYYRGFSNKTIWPLFHDMLGQFSFDLENWNTYLDVNRRFAEKVVETVSEDSIIWIHDYQLLCVGHYLRELGIQSYLRFFLHIPFPSVDLYRRLPWNRELLQAILSHDHIGFQTPADSRNFVSCVKWLIPEATRNTQRRRSTIRFEGRDIRVGHYPISIDFDEFNTMANSKEVEDAAWYLRENLNSPVVVLGLDRLDYTKGIPERFLAMERLFEKYPDTVGKITLQQIVVPSRLGVPEYQALRDRLEGLAGRINGRVARHGWAPIFYQFRSLDRVQLLGHYRASDIALVTPLRDGMNLVAKEYCASSVDNRGALILSEFAGAAPQLAKGAILVNPYDADGVADAIYSAYIMSPEERERRMKILRAEIKRNDVNRWVGWFFGTGKTIRHPWLKGVDVGAPPSGPS